MPTCATVHQGGWTWICAGCARHRLSTEIEELGDGASRQPFISPQFICSIACAYEGDSKEGTLRVCVYRSRVLGQEEESRGGAKRHHPWVLQF
jgi:hypothetical protein